MSSRPVSDLTTGELIDLVRRAVRDELAAAKPRRMVTAPPSVAASPEKVALVRRRLRRHGVQA